MRHRTTSSIRASIRAWIPSRALAALSLALAVATLAPRALGADANPPPPGIPPIARRIPESLRAQFNLHVYPSYQAWLANSNGQGDCAEIFTVYLVTQGLVGPRAEAFMLLYLELVPEEAV